MYNLDTKDKERFLNGRPFRDFSQTSKFVTENKPVFLTYDATQFFRSEIFGVYNNRPLTENLTEVTGISSKRNLELLLNIYFRQNPHLIISDHGELMFYFKSDWEYIESIIHGMIKHSKEFTDDKYDDDKYDEIVKLILKERNILESLSVFPLLNDISE